MQECIEQVQCLAPAAAFQAALEHGRIMLLIGQFEKGEYELTASLQRAETILKIQEAVFERDMREDGPMENDVQGAVCGYNRRAAMDMRFKPGALTL